MVNGYTNESSGPGFDSWSDGRCTAHPLLLVGLVDKWLPRGDAVVSVPTYETLGLGSIPDHSFLSAYSFPSSPSLAG